MNNINVDKLAHLIPSLSIKASGWSECQCPWCNDTKKHLQITPDWKWCRCFKCGHSSPIKELLLLHGITDVNEIDLDKSYYDIEKKIKPIMTLTEAMPFLEHEQSINYVSLRNSLDIAYYEKWMYAVYGKFANRLVIPITERGNLYGLIGRSLDSTIPKYLFSVGFEGNKIFYHYDFLLGKNIFVLTEGVFDCITIQKALPFVGAVCLFGKELSDYKVQKLLWLDPDEIVIMLDSEDKDTEINVSVQKIQHKLNIKASTKISIASLSGGDANSLGNLAVQNAFYSRREVTI